MSGSESLQQGNGDNLFQDSGRGEEKQNNISHFLMSSPAGLLPVPGQSHHPVHIPVQSTSPIKDSSQFSFFTYLGSVLGEGASTSDSSAFCPSVLSLPFAMIFLTVKGDERMLMSF